MPSFRKAALAAALILLTAVFVPSAPAAEKPFVFGMLLVGPYNDHGWSQSHYEAGKYVEARTGNTRMLYIDKVNPADRPGMTVPQLVEDLAEKGARLIIANSDDMKDGIRQAALAHPDIHFIHVSGDDVLTGKAPPNLTNLMGKMEYAKMMAGFVAALTTRTGKIAYLGPLENEETRRLAVACFLGAKYAWENILKKPLDLFRFRVSWIGFWFNIPGVTADPTAVAGNFYDTGYDVIVSGLDTTEAVTVARQKRDQGRMVWAMPYEYINACQTGPEVCLGVPYFNWGPDYLNLIRQSMAGQWESRFIWSSPDWTDMNNPDTGAIGFKPGPAMAPEVKKALDEFSAGLADKKIELFRGPLLYQDGTVFLKDGEIATDRQIWYVSKLLAGMTGTGGDQ
ncbi:MAG: BMP family ABC transporter substrate-binding protein [Thermodesulfobacteriota bacterium]